MDFCPSVKRLSFVPVAAPGSAGAWLFQEGAPDPGDFNMDELMESSRERKSVPDEPGWEFAVPELIAAGEEAEASTASLPEHLDGKSSKIPSVALPPLPTLP